MVQSLKMSAPALFTAIFMTCAFTFAAAQTSCRGRCGGEYYRGSDCQCDYECIVHDECCKDYESQCTTRDSCLGRCGEPFKRGRRCTCDSDCIKYNQCCSDYKNTCGTDEAMNGPDSNTPPGETSSCDNVNNKKPKEPSEVEQSEDPNVTPPTFSEGDDPDDYQMPLVTPDPQEDTGDDNLDDPYSETGLQDPEPIPESTSGYEPFPTDLPEPATSDPSLPNSEDDSKLEPTPEEMFTHLPPTDEAPGGPSDNRPTQANTDLLPSDQADAEGPTESTDASNPEEQSDPTHTSEPGTTSPQLTPTSSVSSQASTQPTPSSESYPGSPSVTPEIQPEGQDELQPGGSEVLPDDELLPEGQIVDQSTSTTLRPEDPPSGAENEDSPNADLNQSSTTTTNPSLATTTASTVASKPTTTGLVSTGPTDGSSSTPGNPEPTSGSSAPQTPSTTSDSSPSDTQDGVATSSQADNGPEPASTVASKPTTGLLSTEPTDGSSPSPGNPEPTSGSSAHRTPSTTTPDSSLSDTEDRNATSSQADNGPEPGSESGLGVRGDNPDIWNGPGPSPTDPAQDPGPSPTDPAQHGPSPTDPAQDPGPSPTDPAQHHGPSPTDPAQDPGPSPTDPAQDQGVADATPAPTSLTQSNPTSKPHSKPDQTKPPPAKPGQVKPTSKPKPKPVEIAPPNIDNIRDYQADGNNDTNLCSGRPASAITTLGNGTMVVFRGHYFWVLDGNRVPGPARGITETWGVASPVDTVFTRCNCQGKTYIFKGAQYWRFNNDMVDAGYPKPISTGFDGLRGHITAALSVPEYRQRKESVFFFKRGGQVQKYSYQFGTRPTCGSTGRRVQYAVYTIRTRTARQAASNLGSPINIRVSWRGFPTAVTSAVSVPTRGVLDGYKYYVFSRSKYYNVRMDGEQPAIVTPQSTTPPKNSANDFFKCPKEV